ncbi:membrane protein [Microbacterium phage Zooman]|nr:membrane protein [Microbacterium phage Zooman]
MNKPKPFIHVEDRGGSAILIGRLAIPVDFLMTVVGIVFALTIIYGFYGLFTESYAPTECAADMRSQYDNKCLYFWDWSNFEYFWWVAAAVGAVLILWGLVSLIAWGIRRFKQVNEA